MQVEKKFNLDSQDRDQESATFQESARRSEAIWADLPKHPAKYRVLTGERPTGPLHIGHLFGTLANRVRIQDLGATTFIVIADYQVLTDRDSAENVGVNVREVILDYLASGLDPENGRTFFFSHSHIPELNQLLLLHRQDRLDPLLLQLQEDLEHLLLQLHLVDLEGLQHQQDLVVQLVLSILVVQLDLEDR